MRTQNVPSLPSCARLSTTRTRIDRLNVRARKLLLGRALRRARRKRAAREALERSIQGLEMIGAALWARRARQELSRIGGRTAAPEQLRGSRG
jgi:hypothetical protein